MRKFKLIKWYPSLPETWKNAGSFIVEEIETGDYSVATCNMDGKTPFARLCFNKMTIEKNPEYWEEVTHHNGKSLSYEGGMKLESIIPLNLLTDICVG